MVLCPKARLLNHQSSLGTECSRSRYEHSRSTLVLSLPEPLRVMHFEILAGHDLSVNPALFCSRISFSPYLASFCLSSRKISRIDYQW